MSALTLLGIALGLAMDAFAVAIGAGLQLCNVTKRQTFRLAWHFGLFQAFMPILGWLAGLTLVEYIEPGKIPTIMIVAARMTMGTARTKRGSESGSTTGDGSPTRIVCSSRMR